MVSSILLLLALGGTAFAADCYKDQRRTTKIPTSAQIRKAISPVLGNVCNRWRADDPEQKENTFSYGSVFIQIKRTEKSVPLNNCPGALFQILEQCIEGNNYWGGDWSYGGEYYSIKNSISPANPLLPKDDGGPGDFLMPGQDDIYGYPWVSAYVLVTPKTTQIVGMMNPSQECTLDQDKAATFVDSGAAQYLQDFLHSHSDVDWLAVMDRETTVSRLAPTFPDCGVVPAGNCQTTKDCREYTPVQFYYIRTVSNKINTFFNQARAALVDQTIASLLRIEQMIADFRPDPQAGVDPNDLYTAAGALGIVGSLASTLPKPYNSGLGAFFGIISGILNIEASNPPSQEIVTIDELRLQAHNWLGRIFESQMNGMTKLLARLFGVNNSDFNFDETIAELQASGVEMIADDWKPIAKIFALGWMERDNTTTYRDVFEKQVNFLNQGLVGIILKAVKGKVAVFKDWDQNSCNVPGARWIDGECYMLTRGWDMDSGWTIVEEDRMKKLEESYAFNLEEFYKNVRECTTLGNTTSDRKVIQKAHSNTIYPACFFSLDFKADAYSFCKPTRCTNNANCNSNCFEHCDFMDSGIEGQSRLARGFCFPKAQ